MHCIGMCGPIALSLPIGKRSNSGKFFGILVYNSGRVLTYVLVGTLFGLLGNSINWLGFQQQFSILMGILIILSALLPYSFEKLFIQQRFLSAFVNRLKTYMGATLRKRSNTALFVMGTLNGLLPCGLVYFAIIGSITSYDLQESVAYMLLFGLGTLPAMLSISFIPQLIKTNWRVAIRKALPLFAILIGCLFILRGLNLGIPYVSPLLQQNGDEAVQCIQPLD